MTEESIILRCDRCGTKNRVPKERLEEGPVCGRCRAPLGPPSGCPAVVTDRTFQQEVLASPVPVLVDCWAPWCGPCRMVGPVLEELAGDYAGRVKIAKLNVDENPATASSYGIQSIPTLLLVQGGKEVHRLVGALPRAQIEQALKGLL
jgi:thioredoxin 2